MKEQIDIINCIIPEATVSELMSVEKEMSMVMRVRVVLEYKLFRFLLFGSPFWQHKVMHKSYKITENG